MVTVEITKAFDSGSFGRALESWEWMEVRGKTPVLASLFGDVILQDASGFWFLDTVEGSLVWAWASRDELQSTLSTEEGQDQYLLAGLAFAAHDAGITLAEHEVYSFKVPPVLGGHFDVANVEPTDFVVAINLAGQLHEQIKDLPPGSKISGFTVE
ncbi:MAG: DUF1851 domain-containing protein [Actinomycetota bacterium]|nr:DUF1851 domain-containing protein [Actinomycetota bacterium]